ncbi:MAG TPA: DUF202 domain-containing protein [Chroococcales cyanobacterium]
MTEDQDGKLVREHLANERTYLAWIRTAISMMGLGVVIAKLRYVLGPQNPEPEGMVHAAHIGILFAYIGITTIGMAVVFFLQTQKEIRSGTYRARKLLVLLLAVLAGSTGLVILFYLAQPTDPAKDKIPGVTMELPKQLLA